MPTGIRKRGDSYEASVYLSRERKKLRKTFLTLAAARAWRSEAGSLAAKGGLRSPKPTTVREAWEAWFRAAKSGEVRKRSGDHYKPAALRRYEQQMRLRVLPEFGGAKLADIQAPDLQRFVHRLSASGLGAATVQGTILPLRAVSKHAVSVGALAVNPCDGLQLPIARAKQDRIASPREAENLIAALSESDRALWATAIYAGLRCGELQALRWDEVDLAAGVIRVERGWDAEEGEIDPKSSAGRRKVPITGLLRDYLLSHKATQGRDTGLVFGRTAIKPFAPTSVMHRADRGWSQAGLERITLRECRHTFASVMIAAGVNIKAVSVFMGHANISITLDLYGHLMPGSENEAAELLHDYLGSQLDRAAEQARAADQAETGANTGASVAQKAD